MITLAKKKAITDWILLDQEDPNAKQKIKIDYPSREQSQRLQEMLLDDQPFEINMLRHVRYYIKCTIKDWNLEEDGKKIPIKLVQANGGTELPDALWWRIVEEPLQAKDLYELIEAELQFTNDDKKKLESQDKSESLEPEDGSH